MEVDRRRVADEQGVPAISEILLHFLRHHPCHYGGNYQGTVHSQGHPPDYRELRHGGWENFFFHYGLQLPLDQCEALLPGRNSQDLSSVCRQWVQVPKLGIHFNGALSLASHSTLHLSPEVVHYQLGIFHFSKEYRVAHTRSEHLLLTPI